MAAVTSLRVVALLSAVFRVSMGTYQLQVDAVRYSTSDSCCDFWCGECDNLFDFCLRGSGTSQDGNIGNCPLGLHRSGSTVDGSSFSFGSSIGSITNPMTFSGSVWPGEVQLYIRVIDEDIAFDDHVDDIYVSIRSRPSSSFTAEQRFTGRRSTSTITLRFKLTCSANFYGSDCATQCVGRDDASGHYTCGSNGEVMCRSGWSGPATNCVTAICRSGCNSVSGYCENPRECLCRPGWRGTNCDQCVSSLGCSSVGGYCSLPNECICRTGYRGVNCDTEAPCERATCLNGATCREDGTESFSCDCLPGFTGMDCSTNINECEPNPCANEGVCQDLVNNFICTCPPGWEGHTCSININECLSTVCQNGGTCIDLVNGYNCSCVAGYYGLHCETDIDDCFPMPCINQGSCIDEVDGFSCQCLPEFTGNECEIDLNRCRSSPCQNNGTCTNGNDHFTCSCPPKYTGRHCEEEIIHCQSSPCFNFGSCIETDDNYACLCHPNSTGRNCEVKVDKPEDPDKTEKPDGEKQSGNDASNTEPLRNSSSNTGAIISGVIALLVVGIIITLVVVGTLLFCSRRKQRDEMEFQSKSDPLDNPTYSEKMEFSESNDGEYSTLAVPHYNCCQRPFSHVAEESDYASVDNNYSTVNSDYATVN